ncbi:hypothetical protein Tco_0589553, partial [Tanacetum coccineum]
MKKKREADRKTTPTLLHHPLPNDELVCTKEEDREVMFIEIIPKDENSHREEPEPVVQEVEYFDIFPTRSELAYHRYLMYGPIP